MTVNITGSGQPTYAGVDESFQFSVVLPGLNNLTGEIAITHDRGDSPHRGTIIVATAGAGTSFWANGGPATIWIADRLRARGWRLVDLKWSTPGWWRQAPGTSFILQAERYAEIVKWVENRYPFDVLLAHGNSGASAEIAYGLAHYGLGDILTGGLLANGPPFARVDYGGALAAFPACESGFYPPKTFSCGVPLCASAEDFAPYLDGVNAATALSWSILNGSQLSVYGAHVRMIQGLADCTISPAQGWFYYNSLLGAGNTKIVHTFVEGMTHGVSSAPGDSFSQLVIDELEAMAPDVLSGNTPRIYGTGFERLPLDLVVVRAGSPLAWNTATDGVFVYAGGPQKFAGFSAEGKDNTAGALGDLIIDVHRRGKVILNLDSTVGLTDVGAVVYAVSEDSFSLSSTGNMPIGRISRVALAGAAGSNEVDVEFEAEGFGSV